MKIQTNVKAGQVEFTLKSNSSLTVTTTSTLEVSLKAAD